jgi:hypothetical protein
MTVNELLQRLVELAAEGKAQYLIQVCEGGVYGDWKPINYVAVEDDPNKVMLFSDNGGGD